MIGYRIGKKIYFEIASFLNFEGGTLRVLQEMEIQIQMKTETNTS